MRTSKALFDLEPDGAVKFRAIPLGMNVVTPHLVCADALKAIDFYKKAFGATEETRLEMAPGKLAHACLRIGDSTIFLVDEIPEWGSRSEEHTSELQSLMRISYAVFCLKKKT